MTNETMKPAFEPTRQSRFSYSLRSLLLLVILAAVLFGWWFGRIPEVESKFEIEGPLFVQYTIRKSSNTTTGDQITGALGIDFQGDNVVVYTEKGGTVLASDSLLHFVWLYE